MNIVLLDADVIIDLHRLGVWDQVVKRNQVSIPSIVLREEAFYYDDEQGIRHEIDIIKDAGTAFQEISATAVGMRDFIERFDSDVQEELHNGELEALTILQGDRDILFCTSDKMAIKAIAIMGSSSQGISLEELLTACGISKKLGYKHTKEYFRKYISEGSLIRIQSGKIK